MAKEFAMKRACLFAIALLLLGGCESEAPKQTSTAPATTTAVPTATPPADIPEGMGPLPAMVPDNAANPTTPAKVELGKMLYFDPALSKSGQFSCNSCHNLGTFGVDNQPTSIGHKWQRGGRNAPTVFNSAFWSRQFWDGRAPMLEDQAKGPPLNPVEMASLSEAEVVARLKESGYEPWFKKAFGDIPDVVSYENMARAIAAFERTLITPNAPFDKYARGEGNIPDAAKRGMKKVVEIGCTSCHSGPLFTSNEFVRFAFGDDVGLKAVTGKDEDDHVFRVQSWRNTAMTAPYFNEGKVKTLNEAVRIMARIQLDTELSEAEVGDIVAFLETLTGEPPRVEFPLLPRPSGHALNWQD